MRTLRAFAWLRFRLLANSLRGGRRRDTMEQVSRALAVMLPIAIAVLALGTVVALAVLGYLGGRAIALGRIDPTRVMVVVRVALAVATMIAMIFAVSSPIQSSLGRYTRLLLLPISRRTLHLVEIGAAVVDPWILLLTPGLLALAVGLALGGRPGAAFITLLAGILFVLVLACLTATIGFGVAWLFRSRRRSEMLTLVAVLAISFISLVPAFFSRGLQDRRRPPATGTTGTTDAGPSDRERLQQLLVWTRGLPSQLHGDAMRAGVDRRAGDAAVALGLLATEFALLFALSSFVHGRLIGSVEGRGTRRKAAAVKGLTPVLPFVSAAMSAVAIAQFRTATRSVRGRLIVLLPGPILAILTLALRAVPEEAPWAALAASHGHLLVGAGAFFALYSLQAFSMNLFASDRAGLTQLFLAPIDDVVLARGKVLGIGLMLAATVALCAVSALVVARTGHPAHWLSAVMGGLSAFLLLSPAFVWFSAIFPVASDLSKTGSGGNPHTVAMLAGVVLTAVAALPAALILAASAFWWPRPWLGLAAMAAWTALCAVGTSPFVAWTARAVTLRRENLAIVAQGR